MIFSDYTHLMRVRLAGAHTTTAPTITGDFRVELIKDKTLVDEVPIHTVTNGTTNITVLDDCDDLGAGYRRVLLNLAIYNDDTAAATAIVEKYDGTNARIIARVTLAADDTLHYEDGRGWYVLDINGNLKLSLASIDGDKGDITVSGGTWTIDSGVVSPAKTTAAFRKYLSRFCEGRLTLTSDTPVTTADVTGATTIYFTPTGSGSSIGLYDGSEWQLFTLTEISLALGTLTANLPYDVFVYNNSGTLTLEFLAWTNTTTRATALTKQDGVLVKTGAATRRYLGTFYTTATTTTEDSYNKRHLWNYYNRVPRPLLCKDTTDTWTSNNSTWHSANGNTTVGTGRVELTIGWKEVMVHGVHWGLPDAGGQMATGIGIDSTSVNSAQIYGAKGGNRTSAYAEYNGYPDVGFHYFQALQAEGQSTTWVGDGGVAYVQSGMMIVVEG